jgi:hypothetical protein
MKKILLIAGHINVQFNSLVSLHGNTGTAGEQELNIRITNRLATVLRDRGFEVTQTDANANDDKSITSKDFDLALALHGDMDVQNDSGGGMVGSGDKSVDAMWQESLRIKKVFDETYFAETKIVNKNIVTPGMAKYYMWQYLTSKTPCVLIEMGQVLDPHDKVLLANTDLIANAIGRSICKAFSVPFDLPTTPPITTDYKALYEVLAGNIMGFAVLLGLDKNANSDAILKAIKDLQDRIKTLEAGTVTPTGALPEVLTINGGNWGLKEVIFTEGKLQGTYQRL